MCAGYNSRIPLGRIFLGLLAPRYCHVLIVLVVLFRASSLAQSTPTIVVQWNNAALQGVRDSKLGPPMVARALAVVHTCIFDACAVYDRRARA